MSRMLPIVLSASLLAAALYATPALAANAAGQVQARAGDSGPPQGAASKEKRVDPPGVPAPTHRNHPARLIVGLETGELVREAAGGVHYDSRAFNGSTPGPLQPAIYRRRPGAMFVSMAGRPAQQNAAPGVDDQATDGKRVFTRFCATCHQGDATGLQGAFPPLAMSDYLNADPKRAIRVVLYGLSGRISVNSTDYASVMPALGSQLSDDEVADVLTYLLNNFNNGGGTISASEVQAVRAAGPTE